MLGRCGPATARTRAWAATVTTGAATPGWDDLVSRFLARGTASIGTQRSTRLSARPSDLRPAHGLKRIDCVNTRPSLSTLGKFSDLSGLPTCPVLRAILGRASGA